MGVDGYEGECRCYYQCCCGPEDPYERIVALEAERDRLAATIVEARSLWEEMKAPAHPDSAVPFLRLDALLRAAGSTDSSTP